MERDEKIKYILDAIQRSSDVLDQVFSLCVQLAFCKTLSRVLVALKQINRTENESEE